MKVGTCFRADFLGTAGTANTAGSSMCFMLVDRWLDEGLKAGFSPSADEIRMSGEVAVWI